MSEENTNEQQKTDVVNLSKPQEEQPQPEQPVYQQGQPEQPVYQQGQPEHQQEQQVYQQVPPVYQGTGQNVGGQSQPGYSGQQAYNNPPVMYMDQQNQQYQQKKPGNGLAITSLVLGIVSIVFFCTCFNFVTAILAVIFGIIHLIQRSEGKGMAITGIITAAVSVILTVIMIIGIIASGIMEESYRTTTEDGSTYYEEENPFEYFEDYYNQYYDEYSNEYGEDSDGTF